MGEVCNIDGSTFTPSIEKKELVFSTEYAGAMAPEIIEKFTDFGLDQEFIPIVGQHIVDLQLVASNTATQSQLTVREVFQEGEKRGKWQRQALLSVVQLKQYQQALIACTKGSRFKDCLLPAVAPLVSLKGDVIDDGTSCELLASEVAADWLFYEMAADALSNSYYMRQKYGRYIRDFNGQMPSYEAEQSISQKFIETYGDGRTIHPHLRRDDYNSLKAGIAVELLSDNLIRRGIIDTSEDAKCVMAKIRKFYPKQGARNIAVIPYDLNQIIEHISPLEPRVQVTKGRLATAEIIELRKL